MKAKKTDPMKRFLKKYPFLTETERVYRTVDAAVGAPEPIQLPARAVAKTLAEKLPILQQETYRRRMVRAVYLIQEEFITAVLLQDAPAFAALCARHNLNEGFVRSTTWRIIAALVPPALKEPEAWDADPDRPQFRQNYCPVCGRRPVLADLHKFRDGRARHLICGGCGTQWLYARVGCVYCGNADLEKMRTLEPENDDRIRLDICDACDSYIKTHRGPAEGGDDDYIYRQDWASVHLDLLAEEKGLHKKGNPILE